MVAEVVDEVVQMIHSIALFRHTLHIQRVPEETKQFQSLPSQITRDGSQLAEALLCPRPRTQEIYPVEDPWELFTLLQLSTSRQGLPSVPGKLLKPM